MTTTDEPSILVIKPKSISPNDKAKLSKVGILVIEMENPDDFKFVKASVPVSSDAMFSAALKALTSRQWNGTSNEAAEHQRQEFCRLIAELYSAVTP